jgi:monofunctional biosynthetic peptidoglycan transglycosylase
MLIKTLRFIVRAIVGAFLAYAVLFSIVGTIAIVVAFQYVMKPVREIQYLKTHNPVETAFMKSVRHEMKVTGQKEPLRQNSVPLDSIAPSLRQAVLAAEDDGFYVHPGIDIEAILSAMEYNRQVGANKRGASTITQQLAKNLFLSNERSFERKYLELLYTVLMEKYLGKDRILELYLNYAQWGKNIFGCEAASQFYFHKPAKRLTLDESIRMASSLAAPCKVSPLNTTAPFMGRRAQVIANNMFGRRQIDTSTFSAYSPAAAESLRTVDSIRATTNQPNR